MSSESLKRAVEVLRKGGIIVYPTDTFYALGADPFNEAGIKKIFETKRRPKVPLPVAVSDLRMMENIAYVTEMARAVYEKFLPGKIMVVLRKRDCVPDLVTGGSEKIGIRIPDHPFAMELIKSYGPLTATSANIHGGESPTNIEIARKQLGDEVDLYIDFGDTKCTKPSTIIDASDEKIRVLRIGAFPLQRLEELHG